MKASLLFLGALLAPALAHGEGGALSGPTGLLTVPTARVLDQGEVRLGVNEHDSVAQYDGVRNYLFTIGFAPGLELGGRVAQTGGFNNGDLNDLSFHAKYAYRFDNGFALAIGAQDIGGEAQNFRSRYAVATLPWRQLAFTAGYQQGPDLPQGALGGIEWRPFPALGVYAEYDTEEVNPGFKLQSPPLWAGLRVGANAGWRSAHDEIEGGLELSIPLGRSSPGPSPAASPRPLPASGERHQEAPVTPEQPPARTLAEGRETQAVRAALERLGFESVRTGARAGGVLIVSLENRRYNHSAVDGIGLALGTIAMRAPPQIERIELTVSAYGVPQIAVATPAQAYRDFLRDGVAPVWLIDAHYTSGPPRETYWHSPAIELHATELVVEPVLRSFIATEYGVAEIGLGVRARLTAPLGQGVVGHVGLQAPVFLTEDFRDGENFADAGPEAGLDLLLLQRAHKLTPSWTWLWSVGSIQVFQADLAIAGLEQVWASPEGRHRLNAKLYTTDSGNVRREVALAGYTLFDATRNYSVGLTGGQFLAEDTGLRLDVNRYFGDTIAGVFLKYEGRENMAGGFSLSLPLTPRRDAMPRGIQVKGPRRWGHSLQTTLNLADQTNALKPLLLFEPLTDLDLRRDFYDSGRLGPEYLRAQLPRMREAFLLWGG
jgi:hypothetical protein